MAIVTYLLGAGASANCLPTYENFFDRFQRFCEIFKDSNSQFKKLDSSQTQEAYLVSRIAGAILDEFQYHNTPDTIAKKYFHSRNGSTKLEELKQVLILFFIHQQILIQRDYEKDKKSMTFRQSIDKRYDAFIAALIKPIKNDLKIYDEFRVLTWNYDLQFEIAYSRYQEQKVPYCQSQIQSYPHVLSNQNENFNPNEFSIIHLNGIAYARCDQSRAHTDFIGGFFNEDEFVLPYLTDLYRSIRTKGIPGEIGGEKLLSFAWENQKEDQSLTQNEILKKAFQVARQTEILVIIGYSFPIFNSSIDKKMIEQMGRLKTVYIQSPNSHDVISILKDFNILDPNKIKDVGYFSQFYIPSEWNRLH